MRLRGTTIPHTSGSIPHTSGSAGASEQVCCSGHRIVAVKACQGRAVPPRELFGTAAGVEKAKFYGTIVGDKEVWPAADCRAAWLHGAVFRLSSESPDAKSHGSRGVRAPG
jgi:hypothetical protein